MDSGGIEVSAGGRYLLVEEVDVGGVDMWAGAFWFVDVGWGLAWAGAFRFVEVTDAMIQTKVKTPIAPAIFPTITSFFFAFERAVRFASCEELAIGEIDVHDDVPGFWTFTDGG